MNALLLSGGRVIDPASGLDTVTDVLVRDGRVAAIGKHPDAGNLSDVETVDVQIGRAHV